MRTVPSNCFENEEQPRAADPVDLPCSVSRGLIHILCRAMSALPITEPNQYLHYTLYLHILQNRHHKYVHLTQHPLCHPAPTLSSRF